MSNLADLKIYLTHEKIILTNDRGFRVEFDIPTPGNIVAITVGAQSFHFGIYPPDPPRSPAASDPGSDPPQVNLPQHPVGAGAPKTLLKFNLKAQHCLYISCIFSRFHLAICNWTLVLLLPRLVKILDNSHHFYSTMPNIVIEMTLYVRPSVCSSHS